MKYNGDYLKTHKSLKNSLLSGAGDGTRTRNLLITNQLLYQLSYAGKQTVFLITALDCISLVWYPPGDSNPEPID